MAENGNTEREFSKVLYSFLSGVLSLGLILILGSYGYTWTQTKSDSEEKRDWRKDHLATLDKRFDELKRGQEKLEDTIGRNTEETRQMLLRIFDEQRRVGDAFKQAPDGIRGRR